MVCMCVCLVYNDIGHKVLLLNGPYSAANEYQDHKNTSLDFFPGNCIDILMVFNIFFFFCPLQIGH